MCISSRRNSRCHRSCALAAWSWRRRRPRRNAATSPFLTSSISSSRAAGSGSQPRSGSIRKTSDEGTTLNFEDDLDLGSSKTIPTLAFEWQIAKKHRLGVRWQDITRDSTAQALTEIQWGDEIIPVDADITLGFDITQSFIDYTYYPWVKEKWAAGFGLGFRWMDLSGHAGLSAERADDDVIEGSSDRRGQRSPAVSLLRVPASVLRQLAVHRSGSAGSISPSTISAVASISAAPASSIWRARGGLLAPPSTWQRSTSIGTVSKRKRATWSTAPSTWLSTTSRSLRG